MTLLTRFLGFLESISSSSVYITLVFLALNRLPNNESLPHFILSAFSLPSLLSRSLPKVFAFSLPSPLSRSLLVVLTFSSTSPFSISLPKVFAFSPPSLLSRSLPKVFAYSLPSSLSRSLPIFFAFILPPPLSRSLPNVFSFSSPSLSPLSRSLPTVFTFPSPSTATNSDFLDKIIPFRSFLFPFTTILTCFHISAKTSILSSLIIHFFSAPSQAISRTPFSKTLTLFAAFAQTLRPRFPILLTATPSTAPRSSSSFSGTASSLAHRFAYEGRNFLRRLRSRFHERLIREQ